MRSSGHVLFPLAKYACAFLLATVLIFAMTIGLPDATYALSGTYASTDVLKALKIELGLTGGPLEQFLGYWTSLFSGNLRSFYTREPLIEVLPLKLGISFHLFGATLCCLTILTAFWILCLRMTHEAPLLRNFLVSWTASVPMFVSASIFLYLSTPLGMPPKVGAAIALAIFPSLILGVNVYQRWNDLRHKAFNILATHYGMPLHLKIGRRVLEFMPSFAIAFNSIAFFFGTGIAAAEWMFGIPGAGRWFLDAMLRLDLPIVFLMGTVSSLCVCVCLMFEEMLRKRFFLPSE